MHATKPLSTTELARSTEAARRLLEELRLQSYFFSVEPGEDTWELQVECAIEGGWQALTIPIDPGELQSSLVDASARSRLLADWDVRLAGCKRESEHVAESPGMLQPAGEARE